MDDKWGNHLWSDASNSCLGISMGLFEDIWSYISLYLSIYLPIYPSWSIHRDPSCSINFYLQILFNYHLHYQSSLFIYHVQSCSIIINMFLHWSSSAQHMAWPALAGTSPLRSRGTLMHQRVRCLNFRSLAEKDEKNMTISWGNWGNDVFHGDHFCHWSNIGMFRLPLASIHKNLQSFTISYTYYSLWLTPL